jgi:Domain of unknown function (DUF4185)
MSLIKRTTGPGVSERVNMVSADLGVVCWDPKRKCNVLVFGDNFAERYMRGEWQSPSIVCYDRNFDLLGIPAGTTDIISSGNRRQALDYEHNAGGISTILPCDMLRIRNIWVMAAMIVGTGGLGDERATQFFSSPDLIKWTKFGPSLEHPGHPGNVMLTFDQIGDWVYVFGTGGLARNRPIWLWRCAADTFPEGLWEPWGLDQISGVWNWGAPNERTPVLQGRYGELSFRQIQGQSVLSFFDVDAYACSALTQAKPTDDWSQANKVTYARGPEVFQLYGGYIDPASRLNQPNGMKFIVSQWNTQTNDPYCTMVFEDTLHAKGPLVDVVEPLPKPEPIEGEMTPQQLYELLLRELSASGSVPITTPEGETLTLREAIEEIHYKERGNHGLEGGRPRHPGKDDDQLGHVLNARAEGLFTQACVVELAKRAGIDVGALYAQVQRSIK